MSQNDFNIANQGFPATRADLNSALQALASNSSGAAAPGTTYAYQWWYDTATNILKMRNGANDAWINIASFDQANNAWLIVAKTSLTGSAVLPSGTTAQRDSVPVSGYIRFNTTVPQFEGYNGTTWEALGGNDLSAVAEDIIPDADSTRDLGSASIAWAIAYLDAIEPVGADTTIKRVGGTNATPIVEGVAKAWANLNGTGTIVLNNSWNISSVIDAGTGQYDFNFTAAFVASTDYTTLVTAAQTTAIAGGNVSFTPKTASTSRVFTWVTSISLADASEVGIASFGELA